MITLPIDPHLPTITSMLRDRGALVLTAPPGAGKTTRVPRALHDAGFAESGEILILEPRRLAARLAASRVAQELGEKPGGTVGYSIRFENVSGPKTRIRFLTEAILARRILHDPDLDGVSTVILDEFHERHLATDLALAFLKPLQARNPRLKIVVMSATLDVEPVASYLPHAHSLSVGGSSFDLSIEYEAQAADRPLHTRVAAAVSKLLRSGLRDDILVFLPGSAEIRRAAEALKPAVKHFGLSLHRLHGDLPSSEQRRALEPDAGCKIILSTNVAETSITIPGIGAVIDSGLARVAGHSAWSGFPTLSTAKISRSSAIQRAGRAGRTQTGHVIRLYTRPDFESRPEHEIPEIRRADLAETILLLHGAGVRNVSSFAWFEPPPASAVEAADNLLARLGAIDTKGQLTETGARMLRFPVHPRLARLIAEGEKSKAGEESALIASLLSERDIRLDIRTDLGNSKPRMREHGSGPSDLIELLERYGEAEKASFNPERVLALGLDFRALQAVRRGYRQLHRILSAARRPNFAAVQGDRADDALLIATLAAFPDRVAKRRRAGSRELLLAGGGSATLAATSVVQTPLLVVAVDAEERREKVLPKTSGTRVRLASGIEPEWLAGLFPEAILEKTELNWNERARRVEETRKTCYEQITLEQTIRPADPSEETSRLLVSEVLARGLSPFRDLSLLSQLQTRLALVSDCFPEENWPAMGSEQIAVAVARLCSGKRSFDELESLSLIDALSHGLNARQLALLRRETPDRIPLKSGRSVKVHYDSGKPPWIESRLQDFIGTFSTPTLCAGRVSLTAHLLAPNGRAVQVTQDLEGFWRRHYPAIRQELQRRYPKHAWPEPDKVVRS